MNGAWDRRKSRFATTKEVASLLNVSPSFVYQLLRAGEFPGVRIGNCWRIDMHRLHAMSDKLPILNVLNRPLAVAQAGTPEVAPSRDADEINALLSENARLREILAKQQVALEELKNRRHA